MTQAGKGKFTLNVDRFIEKTKADADKVVRLLALQALRSVVMKSPVDTGRFRANWMVGVGDFSARTTEAFDLEGERTITTGLGVISGVKAGQVVYIYNNLPYGPVLEYGLYPNPPLYGSLDRKTKQMVIKSTNGYSRQAPEGMVRITLRELSSSMRQTVQQLDRHG